MKKLILLLFISLGPFSSITAQNFSGSWGYKIFKSDKLSSKIEIDKINAEYGFSLVEEGSSKVNIYDIYHKINSHLWD